MCKADEVYNNTLSLLGKAGGGEGIAFHMLILIQISDDLCYPYLRMSVLDPELVGFSEFSVSEKRARITEL